MERVNQISKVSAIASAIIAVILFVLINFVTPVCSGLLDTAMGTQVPMRCHYASIALGFIAILMILTSAFGIIFKSYKLSGTIIIALSILIFITLNARIGIGICMNPEMACHTSAAVAKACGLAEGISGILMLVKGNK